MIKEAGISAERLHTQVSECVYGALSAGTTFRFEIQRLNAADEAAPDNRSTYPVYGVAAFAVLLCALQGLAQVVSDLRGQRFYRQNRLAVSAVTVLLSVVLGVLCAVVTAVSAYLLRRGN